MSEPMEISNPGGNTIGRSSSSSSVPPLVESMAGEPLLQSYSSWDGAKLVPVVLNPATDLAYLRKGKCISGDCSSYYPFLPMNFPSPAVGIPPPRPSLRIEGSSVGGIATSSPLPYIGFGRGETSNAGGEYGRKFKEAIEVVTEKISQCGLSEETQQNVMERDS